MGRDVKVPIPVITVLIWWSIGPNRTDDTLFRLRSGRRSRQARLSCRCFFSAPVQMGGHEG